MIKLNSANNIIDGLYTRRKLLEFNLIYVHTIIDIIRDQTSIRLFNAFHQS